jgi:hypothetical protein
MSRYTSEHIFNNKRRKAIGNWSATTSSGAAVLYDIINKLASYEDIYPDPEQLIDMIEGYLILEINKLIEEVDYIISKSIDEQINIK